MYTKIITVRKYFHPDCSVVDLVRIMQPLLTDKHAPSRGSRRRKVVVVDDAHDTDKRCWH